MSGELWGRYRRPGGEEVVLQADPDKVLLYERKGFALLEYVNAVGVAEPGPRDIDRDDSGIPKGPDGSTHDLLPGEPPR